MAARNHRDLLTRSQDLSTSFLTHFLENEEPMYIKDKQSRYVFANKSFCRLYGMDINSIHGKKDTELSGSMSEFFSLKVSEYESRVLRDNCTISTLECNYFNSSNSLSLKIFVINSFIHREELLTITHIRNPDELNVSSILFTKLGIRTKRGVSAEYSLEYPIEYFSTINPLKKTTSSQWRLAWLALSGLSHNELMKVTGLSLKSVERTLKSAFNNLDINSHAAFIYLGSHYGWINYVPNEYLAKPLSMVLKVLYKKTGR